MDKAKNPRYLAIAYDIAKRISEEEFLEGQKIRGRSFLASHYEVSAETIRKAIAHLVKMHVVSVKAGSGIFVESKEMANEYLSINALDYDNRQVFKEIKQLITLNNQNNKMLIKKIDIYTKLKGFNSDTSNPIPFFTVVVPEKLHKKKLIDVMIQEKTGAVVYGIIHGSNILSSPKPTTVLCKEDVLYISGDRMLQRRVMSYIQDL